MISKEEVEHIAKLARLELSDGEVKKMQKDLSDILDYFDLLKKAPKPAKILREKNLGGQAKNLRKDETKPRDANVTERIVVAAPEGKDGYIKVKNIL